MNGQKRARGGRAARRSARSEGAGGGVSPAVWPGLEGGRYRPLDENAVQAVHETALRILAEIGIQGATARCVDTVVAAGGRVTAGGGRLLMP
ncbi:MAG: trimethylamine methyltransferase family protein, partial [Gammaproteobacteria bacterium]|nr:trimethylamine methyltransferase family protein [Gammaproteobacteria bacterium]